MHSSKTIRYKRTHSKKENKLSKLIKNDPDVEGEESEHELSFYLNDRVKLMKEVLKIIKPKKIRTMAPNCMKNLDNEEINSMLLEELLGISNKRLKYIFNGQNLNEEGSSTDPEEEEPIDIISLDDISDDDFIIDLDSDKESKKKHHRKHKSKIKEEPNRKKVKKEKPDKHKTAESSQDFSSNQMTEQNLMSVLELLELQARARAIRSQLVLENSKKAEKLIAEVESSDNEDDVIVESPQNVEIVITSSDSENEMYHEKNQQELNHHNSEANIEDRLDKDRSSEDCDYTTKKNTATFGNDTSSQALDEVSSPQGNSEQTIECTLDGNQYKNPSDKGITDRIKILEIVDIALPKGSADNLTNDTSSISNDKFTERNGDKNKMKERDTSLKDSVPCQSGNTEDTEKEQTKNTINNEVSEKETNVTKILNKKRKITKQKSEQTLLQESDESTKEECTKDTNNFRKQESKCDASNSVGNTDKTENNEKDRKARKCRRKLMKVSRKGTESEEKSTSTSKSGLRSRKNEEKSPVSKLIHGRLPDHLQKRSNSTEDGEGIILNVEQSEIDCINLD